MEDLRNDIRYSENKWEEEDGIKLWWHEIFIRRIWNNLWQASLQLSVKALQMPIYRKCHYKRGKPQLVTGKSITLLKRSAQCCGSGSGVFLSTGSGIFFPDLGSGPFFWWHFLTLSSESLLWYLFWTELLLKLTHETISSKKKVCLVLLPPFYIGSRIRDPGWKNSRIRDKISRIRNTGSALHFKEQFPFIYHWV
jgi:hypothetical protein